MSYTKSDERMQHRDQESSSAADTEESGTELQSQANSDSDGAEESEQWYMNPNY